MIAFPDGFLWGATLSAHQAEGGNFANDWWRWEQRPNRVAGGATSHAAAGHYARYEQDIDLARKLGHKAFLFSVEWSRLQPTEHEWDESALAHYEAVFRSLRARGIEPVCVLQDVTVPWWFSERYGWPHPQAPALFASYVEKIANAFSTYCRWWIPIAGPMRLVTMGYLERVWPPGEFRLRGGLRALRNLVAAHSRAYAAIHRRQPEAMVGVSLEGRCFRPLNPHSAWDLRAARRENYRCNHLILEALVKGRWPRIFGRNSILDGPARMPAVPVQGSLDFIGVSYFGADTVRFHAGRPLCLFAERTDAEGRSVSISRRKIHPEGLGQALRELGRYGLPLLVTGNGIATGDDTARCRFLLDHVETVHECLRGGLDVRGYFYHSLLDSFEWTEGYAPRYGLVHVDRETLARTPHQSAYLFKDICESGKLYQGAVRRFCPEWTAHSAAEA